MKVLSSCWVFLLVALSCNSCYKASQWTDTKKESLKGNVESDSLFAYKDFKIKSLKLDSVGLNKGERLNENSTIDTVFEILLSVTRYNKNGSFSEFERFRKDSLLAHLKNMPSGYYPEMIKNLLKPKIIDTDYYEHKKFYYDGNKLLSIVYFNYEGNSILKKNFTFKKKLIIDSTFFMNGGFLKSSKSQLSEFGLDTPRWVKPGTGLQFDHNRNLIIENNIHYYYLQYDRFGNWTNAIKYYDGRNRLIPVYLRRVLKYY